MALIVCCPDKYASATRHVEGLRVIDASAMPTMVSGNIYAATIVIAEKSVDDMLRSRRKTIFCERKPISR